MNRSFRIPTHARNMAKKQAGFALGYILVALALIGVVITFISKSSNETTPSATLEQNRTYASTLVNTGNGLHDAALRFAQFASISTMTLDATATGLYNPSLGLSAPTKLPGNALATPGADFTMALNTTIAVDVAGSGTAQNTITATAAGLSAGVCNQINNMLHGDALSAAIPTSGGTRTEGCANLTGGNTYYKVLTTTS